MTILHTARKLLRHAGVEVFRASPMTIGELRIPRMLADHGVRTVLDVGANDGGYGYDLVSGGFQGRIVSFEPLPDAWLQLKQRATSYANWTVAPRVALSNENGEADFFEAANSVSSSLLAVAESHTDAAPASRPVSTIRVPTRRLDDLLPELALEAPLFLKLDVQGAESIVLQGAAAALAERIVGVQLEMSLTTLYSKQADAADLHAFLTQCGFECWDLLPGFRDAGSLRLLQYDGVYFRT